VSGPSTSINVRKTPRSPGIWNDLLADLKQVRVILIILAALLLLNAVFTKYFLSVSSLNNNLTQVAPIIIVAMGMTLVIATGGVDLSVGSIMAISGLMAPLIFLNEAFTSAPVLGIALAFVLPVLVAGGFGLLNGLFVTQLRLQPIVATLVLYIAGRGIAQSFTGGQNVSFSMPNFTFIATGRLLGIPFQVILMLLVVAVTYWLVKRTVFGRYVLAVGGNETASRLSGVPSARVKLFVYGISGLLAGIAGLISISRISSSDPNTVGLGIELDAIAAVAVGGTLLSGGRAQMLGTFFGALIIQLIRTTLISHNVPEAAALVVKAAVIIVAVALQQRVRRE
jgi:galactofuranose transport system permease protein